MTFYAHTAEGEDAKRLPESSGTWQLLSAHLRNVARLAKQFARPLGLEREADLAGMLHDLGKYTARFQARLRNPVTIHGVNHWAAGAVWAAESRLWPVAFGIDGHHMGLPALRGPQSLEQTCVRMRDVRLREEHTRCPESLPEILERFAADGLVVPTFPQRAVTGRFAEALRTRLLFSCLVDADFLDTEEHFAPEIGKQFLSMLTAPLNCWTERLRRCCRSGP